MPELPERPNLQHYRREAKALLRAHRAGDESARARAAAVLGERERFQLSDAQFVIAREHHFSSWPELRRAIEASPLAELDRVDRGELLVESGLRYGDGESVQVLVRRRLHRYLLSDRGRAIEKAGKPPGWRDAAERAVEPMNVDRQGVVFVPTTARAQLEDLVVRLADASRAVHEAVVVLLE